MPESALAKKLKLKAGQRAAILNAPEGYLEALRPLPDGVELLDIWKCRWTGRSSSLVTERHYLVFFLASLSLDN